jgi:hypothetical protein
MSQINPRPARLVRPQEVPDKAGCFPLPAPENDVFVPGLTPGLSQCAGNVVAGLESGHVRFLECSADDERIVESQPVGAFDPTGGIAALVGNYALKFEEDLITVMQICTQFSLTVMNVEV